VAAAIVWSRFGRGGKKSLKNRPAIGAAGEAEEMKKGAAADARRLFITTL